MTSFWVLESEDDPPITLRLPAGGVRTIGRTARADFIVDAALVSRVHCRLTAEPEGRLTVEDLGSTNGTLVNGARIERATLSPGDSLQVGRVTFRVHGTKADA